MSKLWALLFCLFPLNLLAQLAAAPSFTPTGGTYSSAQSVTASSTTSGALLFCTTDGSTPNMTSTRYANNSVFSVATTQTLQCIAAFPLVNQQNVQNESPTISGTFWKKAVCISAPGWVASTSYITGNLVSVGSTNYVALSNNTNKPPASNPSIWTNATTGDCAASGVGPGGGGIPSAQAQTIGNSSPSLSGASMKFSETIRTGKQTNILWPVKDVFGPTTVPTYYLSDFYLQPGSDGGNISAFETDQFQFNPNDGFRYMYGMQYCVVGGACPGGVTGLDIVGNSNVPWTYTGISSPKPTVGQWLHYQVLTHRVIAEATSKPCTDSAHNTWPYLYWDHIILNGNDNHTGNNGTLGWKYCANTDPFNALSGFQFQIDMQSHSVAVSGSYFIDNANFLATTDPSSATSATYTISATPTRVINFGARVNSGSQVIF